MPETPEKPMPSVAGGWARSHRNTALGFQVLIDPEGDQWSRSSSSEGLSPEGATAGI